MSESSDLSAWLHAQAALAMPAIDRPDAELAVSIVDDAAMRELNRAWRGRDTSTDVLSFPQDAGIDVPVDLLGDVVISLPTATRQAAERGHAVDVELRVLLAHGLAHLLGHDHGTPDQARAMQVVEEALLAAMFGERAPPGMIRVAGASD